MSSSMTGGLLVLQLYLRGIQFILLFLLNSCDFSNKNEPIGSIGKSESDEVGIVDDDVIGRLIVVDDKVVGFVVGVALTVVVGVVMLIDGFVVEAEIEELTLSDVGGT
ncbi:hypothetical protein O9G_000424 [Rozella allomycis CSF55]|uniref:Uncharacterized protein n=1 Tax=Rozella allomycis (strain CSF55) TaxID=988480 RepID=A0A075AYP4_ROZAC|nr:hypothetical protein O9G_000424 [Rozella allomycis CSF55]|eukprot:EPZ33649.1 hypothetical protein O9G_000424 [Rozella allomycis CSF55]